MLNTHISNLLNINTDSDEQTVRKAFRQAMMTNHPDRGGTHETMVTITAAYDEWKHTGSVHTPKERRHKRTNMDMTVMQRYYNLKQRHAQATPGSMGEQRIAEQIHTMEETYNINNNS